MPRYTWMPKRRAGVEMKQYGRLFDANGKEIHKHVFFFDSDTGEVEFLITNEKGEFVVNNDGTECISDKSYFIPPLRFVPLNPPDDPQPTFVVNG